MDLATLLGIAIAMVSLVIGFTMDGGSIHDLLQPTAALIIFGGTLGATMTGISMKDFLSSWKFIRVAVLSKANPPLERIDALCELAKVARRDGMLSLDSRVEEVEGEFLRKYLRLTVDGTDHQELRTIMAIDISNMESRHRRTADIFDAAAGFSPTMGIIGTVMGLIHVLGGLTNVSALGPKIAVAFTATLYGVLLANVVLHPLANKLRFRGEFEATMLELEMEAILSIHSGDNPGLLREKLLSFLPQGERSVARVKVKVDETRAETQET